MTASSGQAEKKGRGKARLPFDSLILCLAVVLAWQAVTYFGDVPAYLLPPPSAIAERIYSDFGLLFSHSLVTAKEVLIGFLLSIVISVPLAAILAQFPLVERMLYPLLVASQTVPKVAIAPLLVVWFGFGLFPKILIAFLICFFPILVDSLVGFRSMPKEIAWLARSTGASRWKVFLHFQVPAALPNIFAGVKVASTLAIVGAIVGEFVAADSGLGYQLIVANGSLDVTLSFSILIVLSVMGMLLFALVDLAERLALPWHVSQRS
ncbi:ABC transporter permease [Afifella sp. H1R]|uniref:ABC transporter permease n=1 Tax=Afifella sp. H1R TaxID=2908841 RepID=UPI001F2784D2|nr:ABC transporter permease [Afifella sp. H1R]MCF1504278.1 ABC transporter permease [Afifella sp. H1R]